MITYAPDFYDRFIDSLERDDMPLDAFEYFIGSLPPLPSGMTEDDYDMLYDDFVSSYVGEFDSLETFLRHICRTRAVMSDYFPTGRGTFHVFQEL